MANDITTKNKMLVSIGPANVWPDTVKNLKIYFFKREYVPTQLIKPNLLTPT